MTPPRVVVPHERFAPALRAVGAEVAVAPLTRTVDLPVDGAAVDPAGAAWVLVTSARTVRRLARVRVGGVPWPEAVAAARAAGARVGSVGPATTAALAEVGVGVDAEAPAGTAATLVPLLGPASGAQPDAPAAAPSPAPATAPSPALATAPSPGATAGTTPGATAGTTPATPTRALTPDGAPDADSAPASDAQAGTRVLLPASALADPGTAAALTTLGWHVSVVPVYTTAVTDDPAPARAALSPWPEAVVLTAPSTLHAMLEVAGAPPAGTALVAIGPTTAAAITAAGLTVAARAGHPTPEAVAQAVVEVLPGEHPPTAAAPDNRAFTHPRPPDDPAATHPPAPAPDDPAVTHPPAAAPDDPAATHPPAADHPEPSIGVGTRRRP